MAPRLRVLAGTSPTTMTPITPLVNTSRAHYVSSPLFEGQIVVHIKGMTDEKGKVRESEYFDLESRAGVTWSIQVQGRFLAPYSADDILFGNTFDRPLKLPWGTSAVLKFMHYIDPTLEHDLTSSSKPWALSPLIATMPHFTHTRRAGMGKMPTFPTREPIGDDTRELYLALADSEDVELDGNAEVEESGQAKAPVMPLVASPPVLIPGPVPPIPATSLRHSTSSSQASFRNGLVSTSNSTSPSMMTTSTSTTRRSSVASSSSSSSSSSSAFLEPSHSHLQLPKAKRGHAQGSSSVSVSSFSSAASGSSSFSGSGSSSVASSHSSHKSTRSSGLSSIRIKTKDVVRKVKGTSKKGASGGGGRGDDYYEARRKKEQEMRSLETAAQRRAYFASKERRKDVFLGPEDVITTDFCYGFITFAPSLALQLPGGLSFDLMKYWDGQPVRFVCCERPGIGRRGSEMPQEEPWGRIFWCVAIEIVDEEEEEGEE